MSAAEFQEWAALQEFDPLPDPWWAAAKICATLINVNKSGGKAVRPEDVLPFLKGPPKPQSEEEKARIMMGWHE